MVCVFTGHRPEKLPWGQEETDPRCRALKQRIAEAVQRAYGRGVTVFGCGMARGCDLYFAEAVLKLMEVCPEVALEAWLPCPSQAQSWPAADRRRRERILNLCTRVHMVEPCYSDGCMLRRDRAMVDAADVLISVWDGSRGGTGWTVGYARRQGKPIGALWL